MVVSFNSDSCSGFSVKIDVPEWNLKDLYESLEDKKIFSDLNLSKKLQEEFVLEYKGKVVDFEKKNFTDAANEMYKAIKKYEEIGEINGKIATFAYLNKAKNSSDEKIAIFYQNVVDEISKIEGNILFFSLEMNKIDENFINQCMACSLQLASYKPWLKKIFKFKKYNLSDEAERVLYLKMTTSSSMLVRLFDENQADLRFPFRDKMLSNNEIFFYLSSASEDERRDAAESISRVLSSNSKSTTMILNMIAKDKLIEDELRGFEHVISSRNLVNDIEDSVVENLICTVKEWYPKISHRYYNLKAKWFKKDKLNYWDRNAPLPDSSNLIFSWSQSKEIVLKAYKNFSPTLANEIEKFFDKDNSWIDAKITESKASGAFCHPCVPSVHPYMLMNFQGKVYDIMTLAHELGHCVHYMLSNKNGFLANDIPLTFAETASVFGEQLVFRHLLTIELDKKERKNMIAKKVEDMLSTVVRQIAFCDFELRVHNKRKESELSYDQICDIWMEVQKESLGPAFDLTDEYRPYWSYISHFIHAPFYVYAYAFGDCLVNSLYKFYLKHEYNFVDKYIDLLSSGGTKHHSELLKPFGMDLNDRSFWTQGLSLIDELITELEELSK